MGVSASTLEECESIWNEELSKNSGDLKRARTLVKDIGIPYTKRMDIWELLLSSVQTKSDNGQVKEGRAEKLMKNEIISLYQSIKDTFPLEKESNDYIIFELDVSRTQQPILKYKEVEKMMVRILYYTFAKNSNWMYIGGQFNLVVPFLLSAICQYEQVKPDVVTGPNYQFPWMHSDIIEAHSFYLFESFMRQNSTELNHSGNWKQNDDNFKKICSKRDKEIFQWVSEMDSIFYFELSPPICCNLLKTLTHQLRLFDIMIANQYLTGFVYRFRFSISVEYAIHFKKSIIPKKKIPIKIESLKYTKDAHDIIELKRLISLFGNNPEDNKIVNDLILRAYNTSKAETGIILSNQN